MIPEENRRASGIQEKVIFLALLALALEFAWVAMSPCLDNGFINWDETEYITRNPKIKTLTLESVKAIFSAPDLGMYSPLSTFSYALEYHFAGLKPGTYHATSLFLHLANTALTMVLARLLLNSLWAAFFIALLFGIHPAHVESVAWAAERKDVLYAFFYLSSLIAYALRLSGARTYFLSLALFICALLSKPMAVTLPLALILMDYLKSGRGGLRRWPDKIPFFIFSALSAAMMLFPPGGAPAAHWGGRLVSPLYNLGFYLRTLLWPAGLSAMYVSVPGGKPAYYMFAAGAVAGIFLVCKYFRRDRRIVFGAAFFIVMLLPVLQFFPFGPVISADRYTYLSSIGVFFIAAVCARRVWRPLSPAFRGIAAICAIGAVVALTATARVRCAVWKDGISLWGDTLEKQPQAPQALVNLCGAYIQAGRDREAALCLSRAIRSYPGNDDNHYNLGFLFARHGGYVKAEECFTRVLSISPCHAPALNDLGNIYLLKGKPGEAARYYSRAAQCDGAYPPAYLNLGKLALARKDKAEAVFFYEKALRADPADKGTRALLDALRR